MGWFSSSEKRGLVRCDIPVGISDVQVVRKDLSVANGQLVDLTSKGAKLSLSTMLHYHEDILVELEMPMLDVAVKLNAKVAWSKPTQSDDHWLAGCSFSDSFPGDLLITLANAGIVERRGAVRMPTRLQVKARWQLSEVMVSAIITDYGDGGFCMVCESDEAVGTKVHVQTESRASIVGIVRWTSGTGSNRIYGCQFMDATRSRDAGIIRQLSDVSATSFWEETVAEANFLPSE